jgi:hypothetical protein
MNESSDDLLRGAAFHEAGHVVVAIHFGLTVGEVEISDDGSGKSHISPSDHLPVVDQIALCVAGIEAQELFGCRTHPLAAAADYGLVIGRVDGFTKAESLACRNAGYMRALEILKKRRSEVEKLAQYLLEHRRTHGTVSQ